MTSFEELGIKPELLHAVADLGFENPMPVLESINASARTVRYELAQRVRFQLRKTPELTFMLDDSLDYIENIDHLLEK